MKTAAIEEAINWLWKDVKETWLNWVIEVTETNWAGVVDTVAKEKIEVVDILTDKVNTLWIATTNTNYTVIEMSHIAIADHIVPAVVESLMLLINYPTY